MKKSFQYKPIKAKVFLSEEFEPTCECNRKVLIRKFETVDEKTLKYFKLKLFPNLRTMFAVCECGNVWFGFKPIDIKAIRLKHK